jgi:transposase
VRATTAFNRMLRIVGATVAGVTFTPDGIVVGLRRRRRKLRCPCGWKTWASYDRSVRRWRHLDLGGSRLWVAGRGAPAGVSPLPAGAHRGGAVGPPAGPA